MSNGPVPSVTVNSKSAHSPTHRAKLPLSAMVEIGATLMANGCAALMSTAQLLPWSNTLLRVTVTDSVGQRFSKSPALNTAVLVVLPDEPATVYSTSYGPAPLAKVKARSAQSLMQMSAELPLNSAVAAGITVMSTHDAGANSHPLASVMKSKQ